MITHHKLLLILLLLISIVKSNYSQSGVLVYSITPPNDDTDLYLINENGNGKIKLVQHSGRDFGADWFPDASKLVFYSHTMDDAHWNIFTVDSNGSNLQQITFLTNTVAGFPSWSPDGLKILYSKIFPAQNYRSELWVMNPNGGDQQLLTSNGDRGDWSPNGDKIVFSSDMDGDHEIYVIDSSGSNLQQITFNSTNDWSPCWSKFGDLIAFTSNRDGNAEIYKMNSDGSNQTRLTNNNFEDLEADWSSDTSKIAFVSARDGHYEVYIMKSNGSNQTRLTYSNVHASSPAWKPETTTRVDRNIEIVPVSLHLFQNYPNPFNPLTTIGYSIPREGFITLKVYDVLGNEIVTLVNEEKQAGNYVVEFDANGLTSAIYFYKLQSGDFIGTKKMLLLK